MKVFTAYISTFIFICAEKCKLSKEFDREQVGVK